MNDPRFTEVTAQEWTRFLSSTEGQLGVDMLKRAVPKVSSAGTAESAGLKGVEAQGWRDCIDFMESLRQPPAKRARDAHFTATLIDDTKKPV